MYMHVQCIYMYMNMYVPHFMVLLLFQSLELPFNDHLSQVHG